jgi:CheY-like chemotaxis protein
MIDGLLSVRVILLSRWANDRGLLRQAAAMAKLPIEIDEAHNVAAVRRALADRVDLMFLDAALPAAELAQAVSAAQGAVKPPFTVLLTATAAAAASVTTDAVAAKPTRLEEARRLVERSIRVRIPSRVLIVDDSSTMRSIVRKILAATRLPFDVTEAAEGFAAIKLAGETHFDLVFLDYNMPGFSGLETLSELRREKRRMSVVVMTAMQDAALAERVRAAGAAFLRKPFFPADIEAILTRHYGFASLNPKRA